MSKKINILITIIMCIVLLIPNVSSAESMSLSVALHSRNVQFDSVNNLASSVLYVGNEYNADALMSMVNALDEIIDLDNSSYMIHVDTSDSIGRVVARVFDKKYSYDELALYYGCLDYNTRIPAVADFNSEFLNENEINKDSYDDDYLNNGFGKGCIIYNTDLTYKSYTNYFDFDTLTFNKWSFSQNKVFTYDAEKGLYNSSEIITSSGYSYALISSNMPVFTICDIVGNNKTCGSHECEKLYKEYEYYKLGNDCCISANYGNLVNINQGACYSNNGFENDMGGGSDGSEHHIYLKDFAVNIVTKNRLDKKYNLRDFVDGEASQPLFLSLGYTLDKYQSENLYDYQLKVDISDVNGNVKTRLMPLSLSGVTYIPLQSVLSDASYSWSNNLRFYEVSRSTTAFKGDNVVVFSYSYDTTMPVYDSSGERIYPDWNSHKDIMNVSCKLVYKENTSNNYSKSFRFYGGSDENDDGIGDNENPYQPDNDDYDGDDSVEPTPNEPSYNGDGINIVINNTNNNDDDDDDIDLTIYDDDYTDNALRQDLDDGFGLIDNLDTPENDDGYLGLVTEFFSVSIDKDFKKIIMFGISSIVTIAILRFILRR